MNIETLKNAIKDRAKREGYLLNPDENFLDSLFEGLYKNVVRYGYPSCPCRLSTAILKEDLDIVCPCLYRDPDLYHYGRCFCGLYMTEAYMKSKDRPVVPNRRPIEPAKIEKIGSRIGVKTVGVHYRCKSCGNEVTVNKVGGGVLVCCGIEMELIKG
ncbi:MAG: ferredoxin-thioredoxin reductase catalytic domain-containing protein [Caldisericia bacterium]|nr:ferredoxin-thioredoxin reductase catalytic domain-containing protein [Caldisericia bacterium]